MSHLSSYRTLQSMHSGFSGTYCNFFNQKGPNHICEVKDYNNLASPEDCVPLWAWFSGLIISTILTCTPVMTMWSMNIGKAPLALIFFFCPCSSLCVQSLGDTDNNPVSTVTKVGQLIFRGIAKG